MQHNLGGTAGLQMEPGETGQRGVRELSPRGWLIRLVQIELHDFIAGDGARVLNAHVDVGSAVGRRLGLHVRIGKARIRQPKAEGKERLDFLAVEPAIADENPFTEGRLSVHSLLRALGVGGIVGGHIGEPFRPREGQASAGVFLAEQ
jgi:hypothetical protein